MVHVHGFLARNVDIFFEIFVLSFCENFLESSFRIFFLSSFCESLLSKSARERTRKNQGKVKGGSSSSHWPGNTTLVRLSCRLLRFWRLQGHLAVGR